MTFVNKYITYSLFFYTCIYLLFGWILFKFFKIFWREWKLFKIFRKFDGPRANSFIFGHMDILTQPTDEVFKFLRKSAKEYYPHYSLRVLNRIIVNIITPEDAEIIMSTKKHSSKNFFYDGLKNWLKTGLLISNGKKWQERRRILTASFHFNILKRFMNIFNEESNRVCKEISIKFSDPIDVLPLISHSTLNIINETSMGCKLNPNDEDHKPYIDAILKMEKIIIHKLMRPWMHVPLIYYLSPTYREEKRLLNILHTFTRKVIKQRMETFKNDSTLSFPEEDDNENETIYMNKKKRMAMLDILLQAYQKGEIDYDGICEEVDTFMFEGHDTTAAALSFSLLLIANHPEIQEKIYQEINTIKENSNGKVTYEDLQRMEYLERCIKESLRLYPSVHIISRLIDEDTTLSSGYLLPKDAAVHIHIYDILRNSKHYPEPDKFDPDRFLPDNKQNKHPFAFVPFSAGPRNCIGQKFAMLEMKALLSGIIQKYKLLPVDTPDTIILEENLILRSKNGIKVKFLPRS